MNLFCHTFSTVHNSLNVVELYFWHDILAWMKKIKGLLTSLGYLANSL